MEFSDFGFFILVTKISFFDPWFFIIYSLLQSLFNMCGFQIIITILLLIGFLFILLIFFLAFLSFILFRIVLTIILNMFFNGYSMVRHLFALDRYFQLFFIPVDDHLAILIINLGFSFS